MGRKPKSPKPVYAWAWQLEDGSLCFWALPDRLQLIADGKPEPGAKIRRVQIRIATKKRKVPHD